MKCLSKPFKLAIDLDPGQRQTCIASVPHALSCEAPEEALHHAVYGPKQDTPLPIDVASVLTFQSCAKGERGTHPNGPPHSNVSCIACCILQHKTAIRLPMQHKVASRLPMQHKTANRLPMQHKTAIRLPMKGHSVMATPQQYQVQQLLCQQKVVCSDPSHSIVGCIAYCKK